MWRLSSLEMLLDPLVGLGDLDIELVHSTIEPIELLVLLTLCRKGNQDCQLLLAEASNVRVSIPRTTSFPASMLSSFTVTREREREVARQSQAECWRGSRIIQLLTTS